MDSPDDEFETFLRQFRLSKPKALPASRRTVIALATAALVVAALVIPIRFGSKGPVNDSVQRPVSPSSGTPNSADGVSQPGQPETPLAPTPNRASGSSVRPPGMVKSPAVVSDLPTLSPPRDAQRLGSSRSNSAVRTGGAGGVRRVTAGNGVKAPTKVFDVRPVYPAEAQATGIEGVVVLGVVIGEDGSVIETWILRSIPELDQAAINAVSQWQFEPPLLNGEPVEVEMAVTVNFTLR